MPQETWAAMPGDECRRFCDVCGHHVHAIESYSQPDQTALRATGERLCIMDAPGPQPRPSRRALFAISLVTAIRPLWAATGAVRFRVTGGNSTVAVPHADVKIRTMEGRLLARKVGGDDGTGTLTNLPSYEQLRVQVHASGFRLWEKLVIVGSGQQLVLDCDLIVGSVGTTVFVPLQE